MIVADGRASKYKELIELPVSPPDHLPPLQFLTTDSSSLSHYLNKMGGPEPTNKPAPESNTTSQYVVAHYLLLSAN